MNKDLLVFLTLVTLSAIGYDYFYLYPVRVRNNSIQSQAKSKLRNDITDAEDAGDRLPKIKASIASAEQRLGKLKDRFPLPSQLSETLKGINDALPVGIRIDSMTPKTTTGKPLRISGEKPGSEVPVQFSEIEIRLDFASTFENLVKYLQNLENSRYMLEMVGISTQKIANSREIRVGMTLKTWCLEGAE